MGLTKTVHIRGDGYAIHLQLDGLGGGAIESDLGPVIRLPQGAEINTDTEPEDTAINAIESLVLAHACAGIDVTDPKYVAGLDVAINRVFR